MHDHPGFIANFLIMATRHKSRMAMASHVAAAVTHFVSSMNFDAMKPGVVGFDLAGQEEGYDPVNFQEDFLPLHRSFVNITIHAGEMADDDRIWQAMYLLHAKRIGHGLKLINNRKMMDFVRDNGLCVEMCPSSNWQTNSFQRFDIADKTSARYPLADYLAHGITVTVNTDNRFISDTTMSKEFLMAARMTDGGLSVSDILRLVRHSFQSAFLPKDVKDALLKEVDDEIFTILKSDYFECA
jgi:adenosine deaminase